MPILLLFTQCTTGGGCSGKKRGSEAALSRTFVWNNHSEPPSLDPGVATDSASSSIITQLFEGLTEYHPKTLQPLPGVAEKWEISGDGKIYTFHLRPNAKWSNGDRVTADDFEYSWKRVLNPKLASEYAYILYPIVGAEDFNTGKTKTPEKVGVKALDKTTLQITLNNPTPYFLQMVTFKTFRPVHRPTVEKWQALWTRAEYMVSNGPYRLATWISHKEIVIEKNPHYWDRDNVKIGRAKFLPIEDLETGLKMSQTGKIHFSDDLPPLKIPSLRGQPGFHAGPELATYFYYFNTNRPAFKDKRVRQALNLAIDKQKLVEVMQKGDWPATTLVPPDVGDYASPKGESFNPEKARQLLAEAGFGDPATFPKYSVFYNTNEGHKMIAEIMQSMWKQNLGIDIGILNQEWKVVLNNYTLRRYDIGRMGWIGDYADPHTFLNQFTTGSQQNRTDWSNPEYDLLVTQLSAETKDPKKRFELLKKAEEILLDEMPILPIYYYNHAFLLDTRVEGFYHNLQDFHPLKFVSFKE